MIGNVFARIAEFGQDVIVTDERGNEVACRGFLQPENTMAEAFPGDFLAPGISKQARYLLLLAPEAVAAGRKARSVRWGERTFDVLGLHSVYCGRYLTHWEGTARERGA